MLPLRVEIVKYAAETEDITLGGDFPVFYLLLAPPAQSANIVRELLLGACVHELAQTKVSYLGSSMLVEQHVFWLQVSVNELLLVEVLETLDTIEHNLFHELNINFEVSAWHKHTSDLFHLIHQALGNLFGLLRRCTLLA